MNVKVNVLSLSKITPLIPLFFKDCTLSCSNLWSLRSGIHKPGDLKTLLIENKDCLLSDCFMKNPIDDDFIVLNPVMSTTAESHSIIANFKQMPYYRQIVMFQELQLS